MNAPSKGMLRISIEELGDSMTMNLERRISGPWTQELVRVWNDLEPSLGTRRMFVNLCGLDFVDSDGAQILREIHLKTFAAFIADSPLAKHFAEQARKRFAEDGKKGA